jgi:hypothetical protein
MRVGDEISIAPRHLLLRDLMCYLSQARWLSRTLWSSQQEGDLDKHIDFFIDLETDLAKKIDHIGNEIA